MGETTLGVQILETLKTIAPWVSGGLAGAILTILVKSREKRKKRKIITIDVVLNPFSIPKIRQEPGLSQDDLSISFKGKPYRNLVYYRTIIRNTGNGGIENPTFIYLFPNDTDIIEQEVSSAPLQLDYKKEIKTTEASVEYSLSWNRIENPDEIIVTFLLDCPNPESIKCIPRGLESVEFKIGQAAYDDELENRIRILISLAALFVVLSAIPLFGNLFKSLVVLFSAPHVVYIIRTIRRSKKSFDHIINIGNVSVDKDGNFSFKQYLR